MTSILDRPLKARTFTGVSVRRRLTNVVATLLVTLSVGVALVPLIWVLYSVVAKGSGAVRSIQWWTHSQADMTAFMSGGGAYHADEYGQWLREAGFGAVRVLRPRTTPGKVLLTAQIQ